MTALLTDKYELTMLAAALRDGTAHRRTTFEVFARRLPDGRRYGVVAGTGRFLEALPQFRFDDAALAPGRGLPRRRRPWPTWPTTGSPATSTATPRASCTSPAPPCCRVHGTLRRVRAAGDAGAVDLQPRLAIASAAARMVSAAEGRPLIEMGSRRTHEQAAVAAARAAYIAGLHRVRRTSRRSAATACPRSGPARTPSRCCTPPPTDPTSRRRSGRRSTPSASAPRCSSTPTTSPPGVANAVAVAGPELGAVRIDSGDLGVLARQVRAQLDGLGATEHAHRRDQRPRRVRDRRRCAPNPSTRYGVGTSLVTGSGAPTAGMVYKLVEVDGVPVAKRSSHKESHGGRKQAHRLAKSTGHRRRGGRPPGRRAAAADADGLGRPALARPAGARRRRSSPTSIWQPRATASRRACTACPWDGLKLSRGEPAIPTRMVDATRQA